MTRGKRKIASWAWKSQRSKGGRKVKILIAQKDIKVIVEERSCNSSWLRL